LSRRRALWGGLCALCVSVLAHAASPPDILVVVQTLDDIVTLDPAGAFELSSVQTCGSVYERLVRPDRTQPSLLRPSLATSWQIGADGHSLDFELASGAKFAAGHPVRPEDVVFSLSRAVKLNLSAAFILNELGWNPDNVARYLLKIDANHVRLSWPKDVGPAFVLNILTAPVASIVDTVELQQHESGGDYGNHWLSSHSAGSGPFKIRRYIPHEALVLDANPTSTGGAPLLKTIVLRNVADAATRRLLVEVGDADIARDLGPDQIAALQGKRGVKTLHWPSATLYYLILNTASASNPALKNPAVWEAVRWLIDYEGIANKLLQGQFQVHQAMLPAGFPGALATTPYHLDVAKARSILAAAGLGAGVTIKLEVFNQPPFIDIAQSLQATFAQGGINLQLLPEEAAQVYARLRTRQEEAAWLYWIPDYFDANSTASAFASNGVDGAHTVAWRAGWEIPELSAQTKAAVETRDPDARNRLYLAIQQAIQARSPFVFAFQERTALVMRDRVQGYSQGLDADMAYYDRVTK
jgi:peptide/nickel transport system substrate-binding protein